MKKIVFIALLFLLKSAYSQIGGTWQGVLIQKNQDNTTSNYAIWVDFKTEGNNLSGYFRSERANTSFFKISKITGTIHDSVIIFKEGEILTQKTEEGYGWCSVQAKVKYNAKTQKLTGTYASITNGCLNGELVLIRSNKPFNSKETEIIELSSLDEINSLLVDKKSITRKQFVLEDVHFQSGKYKIEPSSISYLNKIGKILLENSTIKILLKGHTDNDGNDENNFILSQKRAESIASYLTSLKINPSRISFEGYGESRPISNNETEDNKRLNRRVELLIISQ